MAHLREQSSRLRTDWADRIHQAHLLEAMTAQEMAAETTSVYDNYVEVLETGSVEALHLPAREPVRADHPARCRDWPRLSASCCSSGMSRALLFEVPEDVALLNRVLDAYEPAANRIANTVAVSFVEERERVIRQQQEAIRELSTPVLPVRERLLILPIIGLGERARQLTEQLLAGVRKHRARVVVIDITGAPDVDETVASHLVQTVDASRLMGASVIITGLSKDRQTLVTIGVLNKMDTMGDLKEAREGGANAGLHRRTELGGLICCEHRAGARLDPAARTVLDRVHPHRPGRLRDDPVPRRPHRADRRIARTGSSSM